MQDEHGTGAQPLQPNVMELLETAGDLRGSAVQSSQLPHKRLLTPEQFQEALDNPVELKTGQIQQNLGQGLVDAHLMQEHRRFTMRTYGVSRVCLAQLCMPPKQPLLEPC